VPYMRMALVLHIFNGLLVEKLRPPVFAVQVSNRHGVLYCQVVHCSFLIGKL